MFQTIPTHWIYIGISVLLIIIVLFAFWVWMLIDCLQTAKLNAQQKLVWVLVIMLFNILGAFIYLFAVKAADQPQVMQVEKKVKIMAQKGEEVRRLYRSRKNRVIAGVCGGVAEYFSIDPVIMRLAWVFFALITMGAGIIAYIIAWIVIPEVPAGEA